MQRVNGFAHLPLDKTAWERLAEKVRDLKVGKFEGTEEKGG